jgi:hypothetical protein
MTGTAKRAAIYLRVSTREQSTDMQRAALEEVAGRAVRAASCPLSSPRSARVGAIARGVADRSAAAPAQCTL